MSPFVGPYTVHLGATRLARTLEQDARRRAMQSPPEEREKHFEQANKIRDLLFVDQLLRSLFGGR